MSLAPSSPGEITVCSHQGLGAAIIPGPSGLHTHISYEEGNGEKYRTAQEDTGRRFLPFTIATDWDDTRPEASFSAMRSSDGPAAMFSSFRQIFFGTAPPGVRHPRRPP